VSGELQGSTLYQYVTETDGSVSTCQFEGAVFKLTNAGQWKGDAAVLSVADGAGHTLQFRRPSALDRLRLFKALGPVLSGNDR